MKGERNAPSREALNRDREGERAEEVRQQARKEVRWSLFAIECQEAVEALIKRGLVTKPKTRIGRRWPGQTDRQKWVEDNKAYLDAYKKKWKEGKRQVVNKLEDNPLVTSSLSDKKESCDRPSHLSASSTPMRNCLNTSSSASRLGLLNALTRFDVRLSAG